jgi:hypothetical protein
MSTPSLLPTTLVGSYPQPDWLIDRERLGERLPPRVRAQELWRVSGPWLEGRVSANRGWRAVNGSLVHPAASSAASRRRLAARGRVLGRPDSWTIGAPCVLATNAEPLAG